MIVVADSSPLIVMIKIGHIALLSQLFGEVIIPTEVAAELKQSNRPQAVRDFMASLPSWLLEQAPTTVAHVPGLHAGELAALSLALELKADLLLIDEMKWAVARPPPSVRFRSREPLASSKSPPLEACST